MHHSFSYLFYSTALIFSLSITLYGQSGAPSDRREEAIQELTEFVVTAGPLAVSAEEMAVPVSILSGSELSNRAQNSLGETLAWEPGVNSTWFGPGASRPVIRGFEGDRIRVLRSGVDSLDVSNTSPDHAVAVEPLLVDRIEVIRGPATLLYGSSAIGGAVNVIGKEIPREPPTAAATGIAEFRYDSVSKGTAAAASAQGRAGGLAWSFNGLDRESGDFAIPGFAEAEEEGGHHHEEEETHEEEARTHGLVENTSVETRSGSVGFASFWDKGMIGFSVSALATDYGVPGHSHGHEDDHAHGDDGEEHEDMPHEDDEEAAVSIDLDQVRFDLRAKVNDPLPFLTVAEFRFGYADYRHRELEGDAIGSEFLIEGFELRAEAVHEPVGKFKGAFGLQFRDTDFSSIGEEAFIPANNNSNWALFLVERAKSERFSWELGARFEQQTIELQDQPGRFDGSAFSASAGVVGKFEKGYSLAFSLARSERLPSPTETLAFGPHAATRAFEIGDPQLGTEQSVGIDVSIRKSSGPVTGSAGFFYNRFDNFIYLEEVDADQLESRFGSDFDSEGFEVFEFVAREAEFWGFEAEATIHLRHEDRQHLHLDLLLDYVRATNRTDDTPLPRIPPIRFGARLEYESPRVRGGIEGRIAGRQERVAPEESPTEGYFLLNADLGWKLFAGNPDVEVFARAANLTDAEARVHTSFLKSLAPLPGRNLTVGARMRF